MGAREERREPIRPLRRYPLGQPKIVDFPPLCVCAPKIRDRYIGPSPMAAIRDANAQCDSRRNVNDKRREVRRIEREREIFRIPSRE
jgi:hypothetical protein